MYFDIKKLFKKQPLPYCQTPFKYFLKNKIDIRVLLQESIIFILLLL